MAVDERSRHQLYQRLEEALGAEAATTLMEHLPPVGWADVATKRDLDHLAAQTRQSIDQLRSDFDHFATAVRSDFDHFTAANRAELHRLGDRLRAELYRETRKLLVAMVGVNLTAVLTVAGVVFAGTG